MSGSERKRASKWDSKEDETQHLSGNNYSGKSGSYFRDYPEGNGRNGSRRSGPVDDDVEHLKSRQHSGEAWPPRSRASHDDGGDAMMGYYEQDENKQQYFHQSPSKDWPRSRRSRSNSRSRSRSRSPLQRVKGDGGRSNDRQKKRARLSPRSGREIDGGRYNDWESKNRKTRDTKYYTEDSREQQPVVRVSGRTEYSSCFPEDNSNSRRETSDPILGSHRNDSARDREPQRRDVPEGEFRKSSNVPCRFFASGYCRNGNNCRFFHQNAPPERKPQHDNDYHGNKFEICGVSNKAMSEAKRNNSSWIDDMEMSPDWNYGAKTLKKPVNEEQGQSSQSRVLKDAFSITPAAITQQDGNRRGTGMFSTVGENTVSSSSQHNFSNNLANLAPPVQAFNQNTENHIAMPYQGTPLAVGGSQVLLTTSTNLPGGLNSSIPENENAVSKEELKHISNISASLAQFFGNGKPVPHLHATLNPPEQAMQVPQVYGNKEQSSHAQINLPIPTGGVAAVTINKSDTQVWIPDSLASLAGNVKASSEENGDKEADGRKTGEEEEDIAEDAENIIQEEEEEEEDKKGKDPKGMRAFKFALVEIVKELLKPAWKEGGMNKDAYKNIVKKVVDKVTGAIQTGNIPQTQDKIDHYLSASKPKLTKLVQAYISKVKKS